MDVWRVSKRKKITLFVSMHWYAHAVKESVQKKQLWAALLSVDGVGRSTFRHWLRQCKKHKLDPNDIWVCKQATCNLFSIPEKIQESIRNFKKEHTLLSYWEMLQSKDISVVLETEKQYPSLLTHTADRPLLLYVKGGVFGIEKEVQKAPKTTTKKQSLYKPLWEQAPIAIVGTRRITGYGTMVTQKIAGELATAGSTIISGFMYGVDVCAQKKAQDVGGKTVGVLGFGFDHMYPKSHTYLFESMLEKGAVFITEFAPHIQPKAGQFPTRNRIIAGMSLGVLVTEAATRSGSMITADCALEYGRTVFAVPGPITNPYSEGTRGLVNQGAVLVGSGSDVLEELQLAWEGKDAENSELGIIGANETKIQTQILEILSSFGTATVQKLAKATGLPVTTIVVACTELEIVKRVKKEGGGWVVGC